MRVCMWRGDQTSPQPWSCVNLLWLWGEDLPFLKDQLVGCGAVHLLVGQTSLEFKPGLHRNTVLEKQKQQNTPWFLRLERLHVFQIPGYYKDRPLAPRHALLSLSFLHGQKTSWIDEDSVSPDWESADIYPSSKGLSLLRTKTKSQVDKMFSSKATLVSASELHLGVPAL